MQNFEKKLDELKLNSCFRSIKDIDYKEEKFIIVNGKKMLNLSSNDYLNISTNKDLKLEFIDRYKNNPEFLFSSASARLLTGTSCVYNKLEQKFANLFKKDSALIFNTGYQCNQGIISALLQKNDCIFSDKLNHASIVSGLKLSLAQHFRYKHNDYENLEKLLKEKRNEFNNAIIISESVFSMDGDIADIKKLVELKKKYNCLLMIDEAHAFGVFGENLCGVSEEENLLSEVDIITITLGKALASSGAICVANKIIIDYLINKASSFIFSTAIAPVNVMWSNFLFDEKYKFLKSQKEKLNDLFNKVHLRYPTISSSQIIPMILNDAKLTSSKAQELQNNGFYVLPINPPTVPQGTSRLRISLTADIKYEEICNIFG
ncbi:MAG: pyridoxal phosphate-dependent aminotransferase family protein [Candidatus Gastranaerophilales bacterium]|nr:pyridoxal phosphate-dependent aminotransferase family protein [Candidatus Gastranaerophilales bacterium]